MSKSGKDPLPVNKDTTIRVLNGSIDIARQSIWAAVNAKQLDNKRAENMLVNFEKALQYCNAFLHDQLTAETAQFVKKIRNDRTVLIGHQAQAIYFSMDWNDIHQLSKDIYDYEDGMKDAQEAEQNKTP